MARTEESNLSRRAALIALALIVSVSSAIAVHGAMEDSVTVDEIFDLAAGTSHLVHRDGRIVPEHSLLGPVVPSSAALLAGPAVPKGENWDDGAWFDYVGDWVRAQDPSTLDRALFLARLVSIAANALAVVVVYALATRLSDRRGGLVAAGAWATIPAVIGFGHLATLDVFFALTLGVVGLCTHRFVTDRTDARAAVLGLAGGACLLARSSGLLVMATIAVVILANQDVDARARARHLGLVAVLAVATVWVPYRAIDPSLPEDGPVVDRYEALVADASSRGIVEALAVVAPLPLEYRAGTAFLFAQNDDLPTSDLLGADGRPADLVRSLGLRLPPSTSILFAVAAIVALRRRRRPPGAGAVVALAAVSFVQIAVQPPDPYIRYQTGALALACVLAGAVVARRWRPGVTGRWIAAGSVVQAACLVSAIGSTIAWTIPGFDGQRDRLPDLDYGQERELALSLGTDHAALLSTQGQELPGMPAPLPDDPADASGTLVVGHSQLDEPGFEFLEQLCEPERIGDTLLVYDLDAMRPDCS